MWSTTAMCVETTTGATAKMKRPMAAKLVMIGLMMKILMAIGFVLMNMVMMLVTKVVMVMIRCHHGEETRGAISRRLPAQRKRRALWSESGGGPL